MVSEVSRSLAGSDCMEGRPATWVVHGWFWSCMVLLHGSFGAALYAAEIKQFVFLLLCCPHMPKSCWCNKPHSLKNYKPRWLVNNHCQRLCKRGPLSQSYIPKCKVYKLEIIFILLYLSGRNEKGCQ